MEKLGETLPVSLIIPTEALENLIKFHSSKTCGRILKRIEITDNKEVMKSQIREMIYEQYRDFGDMILALNYGLSCSEFVFKAKEKNGKEKVNGTRE